MTTTLTKRDKREPLDFTYRVFDSLSTPVLQHEVCLQGNNSMSSFRCSSCSCSFRCNHRCRLFCRECPLISQCPDVSLTTVLLFSVSFSQSLIRHVTDKTRILLLSHRGSQVSCQITRRDHRRSWSHKLDIFLLVLLLSIPSKTDAGFSCLTHCDCFYKSNKLIADCGSQGLQFLPQVSFFSVRHKSLKS